MAGGIFERGLSDRFLDALEAEAQRGSWWSDVLADKRLLIAVRKESMNVYWRGQSLFNVDRKGMTVRATTHPKYLLDPAVEDLVSFDGQTFDVRMLSASGFLKSYRGPETIEKMKKAAGLYAGEEKKGVHRIACRDAAVIDVEIALSTSTMAGTAAEDEKLGEEPRVDIAILKAGEAGEARLMFWEAKHFGNGDLRAKDGDALVVGQIRKYRQTLAHHHDDVLKTYKRVSENLVRLSAMSGGKRAVAPVVRDVAEGRRELSLDAANAVGIVIFGYDDAQKASATWKAHLEKLEGPGKNLVVARGRAESVRL